MYQQYLLNTREKELLFHFFQNVLQFLGQGAFLDRILALPRVFQAAAMQKQPVQSVLFLEFTIQGEISITGISQERVPDACEVCPDLVHTARFQVDFYQVVAVVVFFDAIMGDGLFPFLVYLHLGALGVVRAGEGGFDGSFFFFEVSFD